MSLMIAALLLSAQTAEQAAPAPTQQTAPADAPQKAKKICKLDDLTSGSRMSKRLCLTEDEWAQRSHSMYENSRSGTSSKAQDH